MPKSRSPATGSPRKGKDPGHRSITFRLPLSLYDSLTASAARNHRSRNAELVHFLDTTYCPSRADRPR